MERTYTREQLVRAMTLMYTHWIEHPENYASLNDVAEMRISGSVEQRPDQAVDNLLAFVRDN